MSDQEIKVDPHFMQLVLSLQAAAMQQMGKVASLVSGEIERDLAMARQSIDLLGMLDTKTKGNLTDDEARILSHVLYELRLNFVDESKKQPPAGEAATSTPAADSDSNGDKGAEDDTSVEPDKNDDPAASQ
ncbi:MAG: DUF1844 domain-containing protein [bacterium]